MKTEQNNKAVIYARVSSREQEETGYSLPAQEKLLQEYASRNEFDVVKVFKIAESASGSKQRRVFGEMMDLMDKEGVPNLLCEKVDRLTRNLKEAVVANDWIEEDPLRHVHFVKQNLVLHARSKSDEKFRWDIEIVLAKKYIANLSEEVKKGQQEKIAQGWRPSVALLGYKTIGEKGHKIHVVDEKVAPYVKKMFTLYATGNYSTDSLCEKMYKLGMRNKNGNKVVKSRIHELLKEPFFYGKILWMEKMYNGKHEPIIEKKLFDKVQLKLTSSTASPYYSKHQRELQGKITCGNCGLTVTWEKQRGHIYGGCKHCKSQLGKNRKYIKQDELEDCLLSKIVRVAPKNAKVLTILEKALKEHHSEEIEYYNTQINSLNNQLIRIQQRMSAMYDDKLDGRISGEMYDEKLVGFKEEKEEIEATIKRLNEDNNYHYETGLAIHELALKAKEIYYSKKASVEERRLIIAYGFSNISILQGNTTVIYSKAFDFMEKYVTPVNDVLEHEKTLDKQGSSPDLVLSYPSMLRRQDSNLRQID